MEGFDGMNFLYTFFASAWSIACMALPAWFGFNLWRGWRRYGNVEETGIGIVSLLFMIAVCSALARFAWFDGVKAFFIQ